MILSWEAESYPSNTLLRENQTFIAQSYWAGMYTGRLDLTLNDNTSPFNDAEEKFRIEKEMVALGHRLERIKNALEEEENSVLEFSFQKINKKRIQLQETLDSLDTSLYTGNFFKWQMVPLNNSYKEDRKFWAG